MRNNLINLFLGKQFSKKEFDWDDTPVKYASLQEAREETMQMYDFEKIIFASPAWLAKTEYPYREVLNMSSLHEDVKMIWVANIKFATQHLQGCDDTYFLEKYVDSLEEYNLEENRFNLFEDVEYEVQEWDDYDSCTSGINHVVNDEVVEDMNYLPEFLLVVDETSVLYKEYKGKINKYIDIESRVPNQHF